MKAETSNPRWKTIFREEHVQDSPHSHRHLSPLVTTTLVSPPHFTLSDALLRHSFRLKIESTSCQLEMPMTPVDFRNLSKSKPDEDNRTLSEDSTSRVHHPFRRFTRHSFHLKSFKRILSFSNPNLSRGNKGLSYIRQRSKYTFPQLNSIWNRNKDGSMKLKWLLICEILN